MTEQELLYHFPFRIDKEHNFRSYIGENNAFAKRNIPNYDGTNVDDFLYKKSGLPLKQIHEYEYLYENYSRWQEWYKNGRNIFSFSKELLLMLSETDASDVKPEMLKLPYDIFYLSLKPLNLKLTKDDEAVIEGVYVDHNIWNMNGEHPEGYCDLSFYFAGDFKEIFLKYIPTVKITLPLTAEADEFDDIKAGSFWLVYLWFQKSENRETVKQAVGHFKENLKNELLVNNRTPEEVTAQESEFYSNTIELLEQTINVVMNCLLYLSQPKEKKDIERRLPTGLPGNFEKKLVFARTEKEKQKIADRASQSGFSKINYVGQSFKRKYEAIVSGISCIQPHWRRGHWRNQKFGRQLNESKLIWIMPTIVKSEAGLPSKGHLYDVQDSAPASDSGMIEIQAGNV